MCRWIERGKQSSCLVRAKEDSLIDLPPQLVLHILPELPQRRLIPTKHPPHRLRTESADLPSKRLCQWSRELDEMRFKGRGVEGVVVQLRLDKERLKRREEGCEEGGH